jgi:hypothetical protein
MGFTVTFNNNFSFPKMGKTLNKNSALGSFTGVLLSSLIFCVVPISQGFLVQHLIMFGFVVALCFRAGLKLLKLSLVVFIFFGLQMIVVTSMFGLGERFLSELLKFLLLIYFSVAMVYFSKACNYFIDWFPVSFLLLITSYMLFSENQLVYGGRFGVALDSEDSDKMISPNTIGFVTNLCFAAILARGYRKIKIVMFLLILIIIFKTTSRGALITFIATTIAFFGIRRSWMILLFSIVSSVFIVNKLDDNFKSVWRIYDASGSGRSDLFLNLLDNMLIRQESIFFGFGFGSISEEIYHGKIILSAHNIYIEIIYTFGMVGLLVFFIIIKHIIQNRKMLSVETKLYLCVFGISGLSEDCLGAHTLPLFGLIIAKITSELNGSSLLSVGSTRFQDGEAAWRFIAPTEIDPRDRRQLLRWP